MAKRDESKRAGSEPSRKEEFKARQRRAAQTQRLIPILMISVFAIAVVAFLIVSGLNKSVSSRPFANGLSMGKPEALVTVEEFADFQCPSCAVFTQEKEADIVKKYVETGKILFIYHPYSFLGAESNAAAEAAYCANDQGKFWEYHDTLYNNQRGENLGYFVSTRLVSFAKDLQLNADTFKSCLDAGTYKQKVIDDLASGQAKGIDRTPSFLVNGTLAYADTVASAIEKELIVKGVK